MKDEILKVEDVHEKLIIKKCHVCMQILESEVELEKCTHCGKHFLPLKYFDKLKYIESTEFSDLFSPFDELEDDDLIKGLYVLW